jgi:hypothetical protein
MAKVQLVAPLEGIARKSATCTEGLAWVQYQLEEVYWCEDGEGCNSDGMNGSCVGHGDYCEECNAEIFEGWLCLDGGETLCNACVLLPA